MLTLKGSYSLRLVLWSRAWDKESRWDTVYYLPFEMAARQPKSL